MTTVSELRSAFQQEAIKLREEINSVKDHGKQLVETLNKSFEALTQSSDVFKTEVGGTQDRVRAYVGRIEGMASLINQQGLQNQGVSDRINQVESAMAALQGASIMNSICQVE